MDSARVLRSIALAFAHLESGADDEATATMRAAVEALNNAPRFQFVPTPWCDTAVAFAKLGEWNWAMRIATGLVAHDAFDGCSALRDLAGVAARNGDGDRAAALLAQARENAPRIKLPPMRSDLLGSVAAEYARIGRMDQACQEDLIAGDRTGARMRIAVALLECGRIDDALAAIKGLAEGGLETSPVRLVDELLKAGQIAAARRIAEAIQTPTIGRSGSLLSPAAWSPPTRSRWPVHWSPPRAR